MLKLLRKLRYDLMGHNKTVKYLKYATGEIVLVVIGILIALSINNWNEYRKDRIIEKELLLELHTTVKNNQESLVSGLRRWQVTTDALSLILEVIDQQLPYADSLGGYFEEAHKKRGNNLNTLNYSGYKSLENRGFYLIRNQELRKELVRLFEQELPGLSATNGQVDIDYSSYHYKYIAQNFASKKNGEVPRNFVAIRDDPFYYSILKSFETIMERKTNRVNRFLIENQRVLELLETELSTLN